ncbi:MAG: branched-chain amino acid ABC transporter permease [Gemmiger sp.]|uniref:branched-chain amino acid ABC transporter permease n=1 Tax=Gemmiger sp. TaxID=2049027 RepID=UPI002E763F03|nr:branched-chain amino acid ABC transporter permease [Gemmiger sp.]MEE0801851.1 branched-chain amino acid ABC transporter permease [Gemmiger sp.]
MAITKWKHMKKTTRSNVITFGIVLAFFLVVELLTALGLMTNSFAGQLVPICAYVMMAVALNLVVGFLGELSLGHAGFMSVGAFSGTLVWICLYDAAPHWLGLVLAFLIGGVMAGIFGFIVGVPVLRLSGDYLAIVTLAFGEIVKNIMNALYLGVDSSGLHFSLKDSSSLGLAEDGKILINGAMGITGVKKASTFGIGIVLVFLTLIVVLNFINSRAGRAIMAIRDNEIAAKSVGINISRYKLMAFVVSAVIAGMAGVLYGLDFSTLVAKKFDYNTSINILVFVVLGGIGSIRGSVIAAAILTVLPEMLRGLNDYRMLIYAIVLIVMMIFTRSPKIVAWREGVEEKIRSRFGSHKTKQTKGVA